MTSIGPHGRPDADEQAFWELIRDRHHRETGSWPTDIDVSYLENLRQDDETIEAIIAGSDMAPRERERIVRGLIGKPTHGCVLPEDANVTLRALMGGYRDAITARKLPPMNLDGGRVAFLLERSQRRRARWARVRSVLWWGAIAVLVVAFLALCLAVVASAASTPGDGLWWIHQLVYTATT